jgi:EpsI family protein
LPGAGWDISNHEDITVHTSQATAVVNQYDIQNGATHELTLYWYQSRDRVIANEYKAKVLLAYDSMVNGRTAGSIVRILSPQTPAAANGARQFAELIIPQMQKCLSPR